MSIASISLVVKLVCDKCRVQHTFTIDNFRMDQRMIAEALRRQLGPGWEDGNGSEHVCPLCVAAAVSTGKALTP